jgi:tRNA dimethylallyltransferase
MDIGTAKAGIRTEVPASNLENIYKTPILIEGIPHYLIDIVYPNQRYTLFDFKKQAYELIEDILKRGKTPIIAGGTGLYIDCLINNYDIPNAIKEDLKLKKQLELEAEKMGKNYMWEKLNKMDPMSASKIHFNNGYAVIRALEFALLNNDSKKKRAKKNVPPFEYKIEIMQMDRKLLYKKIEDRINQQIQNGLIEETEKLIAKYGKNLPALSSIGYKEIATYLEGNAELEECINLFKQHTRNYAKRQITWFRRYS